MFFPFYIAKRYLFSKKSRNVINIISGISMAGIGIGTLALIVVLSAFNGLEELVEDLYSTFDPEIRITAKEGKTFPLEDFPLDKIRTMEESRLTTKVLEETVLLKYRDKQSVATVKGMEEDYLMNSGLDSMMHSGELVLKKEGVTYAVAGYGIAHHLGIFMENALQPIKIYAAKREAGYTMNPEQAFRLKNIMAGGIFVINPDFDYKYILVPFDFASDLLNYENRVSAIEIESKKGVNSEAFKAKIQALVGDGFEVKTRYELNEVIYKTNNTEKWVTFLILTLILVIATFNLIGSLTMLIIDKKEDIRILKSMGATRALVRNIFLTEGVMIALIGCMLGLTVGGLICWGQMEIGLIPIQGVIVDYYPVKLKFTDFLAVFSTVMVIGFIAAWFPVRYVVKKHYSYAVSTSPN